MAGRTIVAVMRRLVLSLKTRWWIPTLSASLATVVAAFVLAQLPPPAYTSGARMWLGTKYNGGQNMNNISEDQANFFGTQSELLMSKNIAARAHAKVQAQHPELKPVPTVVKVGRPLGTAIFNLQASGPDPTYPRHFLEAVMEEFLQYRREVRGETADLAQTSLTQQFYRTAEDLRTAQARLDEFQRANNIVYIQEQANAATYYLNKLNRQLSDMRIEAQLIESMINFNDMPEAVTSSIKVKSKSAKNETDADEEEHNPFTSRTEDFLKANKDIKRLRIAREELAVNLKPKHPKMVQLDDEISKMEKLVEVYKKEGKEQLEARRERIKVEMVNVEKNLEEAKQKVLEPSKKLTEADRLKQEVESLRRFNDNLMAMSKTQDIGSHLDQEQLSILDHANTPVAPPLQNTPKIIGAGILGFLLGLAVVLLLVWVDDRVGSISELKASLDLQILGQIPNLGKLKKGTRLGLLEMDDQRHSFAESYRSLRSSLLFLDSDSQGDKPKTLLITSSIPAEGKSTVSSNLARAMAFSGSKVLLVEADLRKGQLAEIFKLSKSPGLAELLRGMATLEDVIQKTEVEKLDFISRGRAPRNPCELLMLPAMDHFIRQVYDMYDYVIIDSAPILAADDTTSLAPKMEGVLFVVRSTYTSIRMVRQALDLLASRKARLLGVIYNRADPQMGDYDYYSYSNYYVADEAEEEEPKQVKASSETKPEPEVVAQGDKT